MGFAKAIVGGSKPKPVVIQRPEPTTDTATSVAAQEEERRRRLVAMNQQGTGQLTPGGGVTGQATVSRKMLFGQ